MFVNVHPSWKSYYKCTRLITESHRPYTFTIYLMILGKYEN